MANIEISLLSEQIDLLDKVLAASTDHIYVFDRSGRFLYVSPAGLAALGLAAKAILGKTWHDLNFPPESMERHDAQRESVFQTGVPVTAETRFPTTQGSRYFEYVISPLFGANGEIDAVISTVRDITERKQTEDALRHLTEELEARVLAKTQELVDLTALLRSEVVERQIAEQTLKESENHFSVLIDAMFEGMLVHEQGRIIDANPGLVRMFGYSWEEVIGKSVVDFLAPESLEMVQQHLENQYELPYEAIGIKKDGTLFNLEVVGKQSFYQGRRVRVTAMRDITTRKQSELALQESEARFSAAFQSSPDAILITQLSDGLIRDVNIQFTQISGYSRSEAIGRTTLELQLWADPIERATVITRLQTEATIQNHEFLFQRKSKETLVGLFSCQVLELNGQACLLSVVRDISDRKKLELALQQSQAKLSEVLDSTIAGIVRVRLYLDRSYEYLYVSPHAGRIYDYTPEELMADSYLWQSRIHPDDWQTVVSPLMQTILTQVGTATYSIEYRFRRKDESIGWVLANIWVQGDASQGYWNITVVDTDITDLKQAEKLLHQRESLLHLFAQYAPAGIAMFDREMRYVMASQRWVDRYRLGSIESLLGRSHYEVFPEISERWRQIHQRCLAGAVETCEEDLFVWVDGTQQWLRWEVHPWYTTTDEIGGIIIFSEDITQRKQAELSLQDLNQSLERIVTERTAELLTSEFQIRQQANRETLLREITQRIRQSLDLQTIFDTACQEILQWSQADRVGIFKFYPGSQFDDGKFVAEALIPGIPSVLVTPIHDHCFGNDYAPLYQQGRVQATPDIYNAGLQDCHRDVLAQFQIRANLVVPLLHGDMLWGLLCIHHCSAAHQWQPFEIQVTQEIANQLSIAVQQAGLFEQLQQQLAERQLAEQQLTERNQQLAIFNQELARATRLKDEFLANMSHELRTPLNAILGMAEGLQEQVFGEVNLQQLKALQTIERTGLHLLELINDILDLAKVESGQIELDCASTAVAGLCRTSLDFIKQQALKKRIQLQLQLPPNLPDLYVDERRIRQVLVNLLNNAVKFTPNDGRITLEVIWPGFQKEGEEARNWLRFAVLDTGIGIAAQDIHKLFQPFIQIDSALNRQYEGTGLGLALVKRIVELHGGHVGLTSQLGVGSRFTIDLPGVVANSSEPTPLAHFFTGLDQNSSGRVPPPLILLVEDNEDNIVAVASYLEVKGNRLLVARNGQEAIALTQDRHPDLILMDIQMPGMDGLEAIRQIRCLATGSDTPILALTALAMEGDRDRCLDAGANDYLSKPVKLKQLAAKIRQFLEPQ